VTAGAVVAFSQDDVYDSAFGHLVAVTRELSVRYIYAQLHGRGAYSLRNKDNLEANSLFTIKIHSQRCNALFWIVGSHKLLAMLTNL